MVDVKGNRQTKQKKLLYEFREIESLFAFDVVSDYRICRIILLFFFFCSLVCGIDFVMTQD